MNRAVGGIILAASGLGYPLTQVAIARLGRPGVIAVQVVTVGLLVRDVALVATGTAGRLERGPAALLLAETAAAAVATVANASLSTGPGRDAAMVRGWRVGTRELVRRAAVGTVFGIHTMRFRIYLSPGSGLRRSSRDPVRRGAVALGAEQQFLREQVPGGVVVDGQVPGRQVGGHADLRRGTKRPVSLVAAPLTD